MCRTGVTRVLIERRSANADEAEAEAGGAGVDSAARGAKLADALPSQLTDTCDAARRLPIDTLARLFPHAKCAVLKSTLEKCSGDVLQAIEQLVYNHNPHVGVPAPPTPTDIAAAASVAELPNRSPSTKNTEPTFHKRKTNDPRQSPKEKEKLVKTVWLHQSSLEYKTNRK